MANDGYQQGWHERNGGNLSYRLKPEEVEMIKPRLNALENGHRSERGSGLAEEFFLVTGSGKYFRNIVDPEVCLAIIELMRQERTTESAGDSSKVADLPANFRLHLMNHEVKKKLTNGKHRVIYHAHNNKYDCTDICSSAG